jgi:hypothetical protein
MLSGTIRNRLPFESGTLRRKRSAKVPASRSQLIAVTASADFARRQRGCKLQPLREPSVSALCSKGHAGKPLLFDARGQLFRPIFWQIFNGLAEIKRLVSLQFSL